MTSLDPKRPLREPTPEERARAARMVWLIVLGLPTLVGVLVASLTWNGRKVRDYGRAVIAAAQSSGALPAGGEECGKFVSGVPAGVQACRVERVEAGLLVTLTVEGGRQYQISSAGGKVSDRVNVSEVEARAYAQKVANSFPAYVKANNPPVLEAQTVPCAKVLTDPAPVGVQSCQVQPGPADGPEVALKLTDGRAIAVPF